MAKQIVEVPELSVAIKMGLIRTHLFRETDPSTPEAQGGCLTWIALFGAFVVDKKTVRPRGEKAESAWVANNIELFTSHWRWTKKPFRVTLPCGCARTHRRRINPYYGCVERRNYDKKTHEISYFTPTYRDVIQHLWEYHFLRPEFSGKSEWELDAICDWIEEQEEFARLPVKKTQKVNRPRPAIKFDAEDTIRAHGLGVLFALPAR